MLAAPAVLPQVVAGPALRDPDLRVHGHVGEHVSVRPHVGAVLAGLRGLRHVSLGAEMAH